MLDAALRPMLDPFLDRVGGLVARAGVGADVVTAVGFVIGLATVPLLALEMYDYALAAVLANRLLDGLDGAVARASGPTDRGGFLDIVLDFIFYSAAIFGFALARPENAVFAAFLILCFIGSGSSFLAYAVFAERRRLTTDLRGRKSLYYLGGLTEGTETIAAMVLMCLFPGWFAVIATVFGVLCCITTATRIVAGWQDFR